MQEKNNLMKSWRNKQIKSNEKQKKMIYKTREIEKIS